MTKKKLLELSRKLDQQSNELLNLKNEDYADEKVDALDNFNKVSEIKILLKIDDSPKGIALTLEILKLVRYCNLVFLEKEPNFEAIQGTVVDRINYIKLAEANRLNEERTSK